MILNKKNLVIIILTTALGAWWWKNSQSPSDVVTGSVVVARPEGVAIPSAQGKAVEAPSGTSWSPQVVHQIQVLDQILSSKNDNDPRMDTELKSLSSEAKSALREKYFKLPEIQRNERGTIVFLIGRNLTDPSDYQFLNQVLSEPPCLGLLDCHQPMNADGSSGHEDNGVGVVLDYPQLTALKAIEKHPASTDSLKSLQAQVLQAAKASRSVKVSELAEMVDRKIR